MGKKVGSQLRTGYTTGTCASASSKAALLSLIHQKRTDKVDVILPKGNVLKINIKHCEFKEDFAKCSVIKDGGDDPDVTHGAEIVVELFLTDSADILEIDGGEGVGIVTKPGLGLEINKPAINPVPKKMIEQNIRDIGMEVLKKKGIRVVISVPKGRELAKKTDNPRLGIVGGISILGTSGIVIPYSTASFADVTIRLLLLLGADVRAARSTALIFRGLNRPTKIVIHVEDLLKNETLPERNIPLPLLLDAAPEVLKLGCLPKHSLLQEMCFIFYRCFRGFVRL